MSATVGAGNARAEGGGATTSGALRFAAALVLAAAVYAIWHPYFGIVGDASLYLGRSLADLDPGGVGRDIVFANDGQSRFSIFSRLADPLVAALGAGTASMVIAVAAAACVFAATLALARALGGSRRLTIAILLTAAVMPTTYGDGVFRFAESGAVPRPFAEAAIMGMVAALLAGRPLVAGLFLLAAMVMHPIMAMAGVGTVLVLMAWRSSLRASLAVAAAFATAAALASGLGALGVPLLDRLVARFDPEWLGMLTERSPHLFPSLWHAAAFATPMVQVTTIALAAWGGGATRRRVVVAVAASAVLQLAAAACLGDALHGVLAVQIQSWRALWLLAMVATCCLPLVASELWRGGTAARLVLALLGLAWLCPLGTAGTLAVCAAALALRARPSAIPFEDRHATWALAFVVLVALLSTAAATIAWMGFVAETPPGTAFGLVAALQTDLLVAPAWLAIAVWLLARPRRSAAGLVALCLGACAAGAVAISSWDDRAATALSGRQDGFTATKAVPGERSSEVLVVGGVSAAWFALGRPQYFSPEQAVSIVFSRPLAMAWRRRANVLRDLGLVPGNVFHPWDAIAPGDHVVVTAAKLATFCARDDAPAAVIVPDRDDAPAPVVPGAWAWTAPAPLPVREAFDPPQWHAVRGWIVTPCRAAALAKSGRQ